MLSHRIKTDTITKVSFVVVVVVVVFIFLLLFHVAIQIHAQIRNIPLITNL